MGGKQSVEQQIQETKKRVEEKLDKERKVDFSIVQAIDKIVSKILMENTSLHDISLLQDKKFCDNVVVLTSKILNKHFNLREISYLNYRIKNGLPVDEMTNDKVVFINPDKFLKLDVDHGNKQKTMKKRMCLAIAKFYIKFFHLFSSVIKSINPMYKYTDDKGIVQYIDLLKKNKLSKKELDSKNIVILGICKKRYESLNVTHGKITDNFCRDKKVRITDGEYPGIRELKKLYYDVYQLDNSKENAGTFYKMSEDQKKIYKNDVEEFYKAIQGTDKIPDGVNSFNDIFTIDFSVLDGDETCKKDTIQKYAYNESIELFRKYGEHLKKMVKQTKGEQQKLIDILGEMFQSVVTLKKNVGTELVINNELNEKTLQKLVEKSRKTILNMLMECEKKYKEGILIFKEIIKDKTIVGEEKKIENLEKKKRNILYDEVGNEILLVTKQEIVETGEPSFTKPTYPGSIHQPVYKEKELYSSQTETPAYKPKFMFNIKDPTIQTDTGSKF